MKQIEKFRAVKIKVFFTGVSIISFWLSTVLTLLLFLTSYSLLTPQLVFGEKAKIPRLAYGRKIHYAPQIIALEQGYFEAQGVRLRGLVLLAGSQCAEALTTGAADAAVMGDAPAIFAVASGRPIKIVASYGGGDRMHRIVVAKESGIHSPKDLMGKRVAIQFGSSTHGAFLLFCKKENVTLTKVRLVNIRPTDMPEAMASSQIDAAVGSEPWPSNLEERLPGSYELATLSGLGNEYPLMMLVSTEFAERFPKKVVAMLRATNRAIKLMNEEPPRAAEIIAKVTGVPVHRELRVMNTLKWELRLDEHIRRSLDQTAAFLKDNRKILRLPDLQRAFDARFLNEALPPVPSKPR